MITRLTKKIENISIKYRLMNLIMINTIFIEENRTSYIVY